MRSDLFGNALEVGGEGMRLQNPRMLRIGVRGEVLARQGSMVAYQGQLDFAYEGAGGVGRFLKRALTGRPRPYRRRGGRGRRHGRLTGVRASKLACPGIGASPNRR